MVYTLWEVVIMRNIRVSSSGKGNPDNDVPYEGFANEDTFAAFHIMTNDKEVYKIYSHLINNRSKVNGNDLSGNEDFTKLIDAEIKKNWSDFISILNVRWDELANHINSVIDE